MTDVQITTNNQARDTLTWYDLTPEERAEFDLLEDRETAEYFRAYGVVYCLSDFMPVPAGATVFTGWEGYHGDSFFSGVLVRYDDDGGIIVGRYMQ